MNLVNNGVAEPWAADTAIEEVRVLLSSDPTSPIVILGSYLIAAHKNSVIMVLFTSAQVVVIFPTPRRIGDSNKYEKQRGLREFHTTVW